MATADKGEKSSPFERQRVFCAVDFSAKNTTPLERQRVFCAVDFRAKNTTPLERQRVFIFELEARK